MFQLGSYHLNGLVRDLSVGKIPYAHLLTHGTNLFIIVSSKGTKSDVRYVCETLRSTLCPPKNSQCGNKCNVTGK